MALLKKFFFGIAAVVTLGSAANAFADDTVVPFLTTPNNTEAIKIAANHFVDQIVGEIGGEIDKNVVDQTIKFDTGNFYTIDPTGNPQYLTGISLENLSFEAKGKNSGLPYDVNITISLDAKLSNNTCIVSGGKYSITKFEPASIVLQTILGLELKKHGDDLLTNVIQNSDEIKAHCAQ